MCGFMILFGNAQNHKPLERANCIQFNNLIISAGYAQLYKCDESKRQCGSMSTFYITTEVTNECNVIFTKQRYRNSGVQT